MKAAVWKRQGRFDIEEAPIPTPSAEEVVVRIGIAACAGATFIEPTRTVRWGQALSWATSTRAPVTAVGAGVSLWKEGDRVAGASAGPAEGKVGRFTPRMVARRGAPGSLEQGGFAGYKRMAAGNLLRIPGSIDDLGGSLIEPCAVAVNAVERAAVGLGERVGILGLGPIGLLILQVAKAAGALEVYGADPSPLRRQTALELGMDAVFDPSQTDAVEALVSATGGGPEVMFDCAAGPGTLDQALTAVRARGRAVLVGMSWDPVTVTPIEWLGRSVQLLTMYAHARRHTEVALKLVGGGKIRSAAMIRPEWIFPLEAIHQAFERCLEGTVVKAVIRP